MTKDELKQAAESVGYYLADSRPSEHGRRKYLKNCELLARHYLAQLAEDAEGDDVLVNHDFLNCQSGIECCIESLGYYACDLQHNRFGIDEIDIPFDTTRRTVRQLLAALQIPTTKGTSDET